MSKIYVPCVSNNHSSVILKDADDRKKLSGMHLSSMSGSWVPLNFEFFWPKKGHSIFPQITYIVPSIAVRADLVEMVVPNERKDIELLPIIVSGENWVIINCLQEASDIDERLSEMRRGINGQIFMIKKLIVKRPLANGAEIFTVAGSNRAYTYVLDSFVERVTSAKLSGLIFKPIGRIGDK